MRTLPLLALAAVLPVTLAACTGKGDDTGDTDMDTDTDTGTAPPADFTFALSGAYTDSTLTLTWLDFASLGSQTLATGDVRYSGIVTGASAGVPFGEPLEEDRQEIDPVNAPGFTLSGYIPGLHVDTDGDGLLSGTEAYAGVGLAWPVFVGGEVPADYLDLGMVAGWNALQFVPDSEIPLLHDITAIPLDALLAERESITFGGSLAGDDTRLFVAPAAIFEGGTVADYVYDDVVSDPWSVTLDSRPAADHFSELEGLGLAALEVPLAYTDNDQSGSYTDGDTPTTAACFNGSAVGLLYLSGVTDLLTGWSLTMQGLGTGWLGLSLADTGGGIVSDADLQTLALDGSCDL